VLLVQEIVHRKKSQPDEVRIGQYFNLAAHATKRAEGKAKAPCAAEPVPIGSSVGHRRSPPGTLGLFLRSADGIGIMSNSHILAWCGRAKPDDPIFAPHPNDARDVCEIGRLRRYSSLIHDDVVAVDLAFAALNEGVMHGGNVVPAAFPDAGKSIKSGTPLPVEAIGLAVRKIGRTSHSTSGKLSAFNVGPKLTYPGLGEVRLTGMLEIEWPSPKQAFSQSGDSGSVVYRPDTMEAIGLVVGGGVRAVDGDRQGVTIVCPLTSTMTEWGLSGI
jgi:hypothetical protein